MSGGKGDEELAPGAEGREYVVGGELAVAVEPPEEGVARGDRVGAGNPEIAGGDEVDLDEATVGGDEGVVGLDFERVDDAVEGEVLVAVEGSGAGLGGLGFDGLVPCGIGAGFAIRLAIRLDIDL